MSFSFGGVGKGLFERYNKSIISYFYFLSFRYKQIKATYVVDDRSNFDYESA